VRVEVECPCGGNEGCTERVRFLGFDLEAVEVLAVTETIGSDS
jgi:hypothetical protein